MSSEASAGRFETRLCRCHDGEFFLSRASGSARLTESSRYGALCGLSAQRSISAMLRPTRQKASEEFLPKAGPRPGPRATLFESSRRRGAKGIAVWPSLSPYRGIRASAQLTPNAYAVRIGVRKAFVSPAPRRGKPPSAQSARARALSSARISRAASMKSRAPSCSAIGATRLIPKIHSIDGFRKVRDDVFSGDSRKLMDVRRSVAIEALAGGAKADQIGGKLANSIATNRELEGIYLPQDGAVVRLVEEARLAGRRAIRGTKV